MDKLLKILAGYIRHSGNLDYKVKQYEWDVIKEIADAYFEKYDEPEETFEKGLELGRLIKQKVVYILKYENTKWLAFVGTEAEILRKLEENPLETTDLA